MDVNLFLSLWIGKWEGHAAWLDWLQCQKAEPANDEQERGEKVSKYFDELEVG